MGEGDGDARAIGARLLLFEAACWLGMMGATGVTGLGGSEAFGGRDAGRGEGTRGEAAAVGGWGGGGGGGGGGMAAC